MKTRSAPRRDRQVVRILGVLKALSEGAKPSVHQLAARFHTRRETIYRDLRALQEIGYPIAGDERGRLTHPRLFNQLTLPVTGLSTDEIDAILWAVKQVERKQPYTETLRRVEQKLTLLESKGKEAGSPDLSFIPPDMGARAYTSHQATILTLVEAIMRKRSCLIEYQMPPQAKLWKIEYEPYRLVRTQGGLYSIGWVPSRKRHTVLAVERIQLIELLEHVFTAVPDLDPKKRMEEPWGIIWERPMRVVIRFRADQAPFVAERQWHPTERIRYLEDGRLEMSLSAGGMFEITRWVLGWGDAAEVISPLRLRKHVAQCLNRAAAHYS